MMSAFLRVQAKQNLSSIRILYFCVLCRQLLSYVMSFFVKVRWVRWYVSDYQTQLCYCPCFVLFDVLRLIESFVWFNSMILSFNSILLVFVLFDRRRRAAKNENESCESSERKWKRKRKKGGGEDRSNRERKVGGLKIGLKSQSGSGAEDRQRRVGGGKEGGREEGGKKGRKEGGRKEETGRRQEGVMRSVTRHSKGIIPV